MVAHDSGFEVTGPQDKKMDLKEVIWDECNVIIESRIMKLMRAT